MLIVCLRKQKPKNKKLKKTKNKFHFLFLFLFFVFLFQQGSHHQAYISICSNSMSRRDLHKPKLGLDIASFQRICIFDA